MKFNKALDQYYKNSRYIQKCAKCGEDFNAIGYEDKICKKCRNDLDKNTKEMSRDAEDRVAREKEKYTIDFRR